MLINKQFLKKLPCRELRVEYEIKSSTLDPDKPIEVEVWARWKDGRFATIFLDDELDNSPAPVATLQELENFYRWGSIHPALERPLSSGVRYYFRTPEEARRWVFTRLWAGVEALRAELQGCNERGEL